MLTYTELSLVDLFNSSVGETQGGEKNCVIIRNSCLNRKRFVSSSCLQIFFTD